MTNILLGAPVAKALTEKFTKECEKLKAGGIQPRLAILRVGERPDDISYEHSAINSLMKIGIDVFSMVLPENAKRQDILDVVKKVNLDPLTHGLLMFRPLVDKETEEIASGLLSPKKDVDGMTPGSLGKVFSGKGEGFAPCTADAVMEILDYYGVELSGKNVVVLGRSLVIGRPVSMLLMQKNATVTVCHSRTVGLGDICKRADILVACVGIPRFVKESFVSPGQVVIDVGINVDSDGKLVGDVDFHAVEPVVSSITPVPRGVGSVTTAVLAGNVIKAAY